VGRKISDVGDMGMAGALQAKKDALNMEGFCEVFGFLISFWSGQLYASNSEVQVGDSLHCA